MSSPNPQWGLQYPRSTGEFRSWFASDNACLDYLDWLRWPDGFVCPRCAGAGWRVADDRYKCAACGARTSVTAGTLFDHRRSPLTVWFTACWMFATQTNGISALSVQRAARDRVVPDGVGDAAPTALRPRPSGPGPAYRHRRSRRDLLRRRGARAARWPPGGQEGACRRGCRALWKGVRALSM